MYCIASIEQMGRQDCIRGLTSDVIETTIQTKLNLLP